MAHFKTQHVAYRKTGLEWEILGDLGLRLHHKEDAKEAFQRALDTPRYSAKPWAKLLEMYAEEGDVMRTLQAAMRVAAYQYGEYSELAVCSHHDVINRVRALMGVMAITVPDTDRSSVLQTRTGPRTRKNLEHATQHGSSRAVFAGHAAVSAVWPAVQSGGK